MNGRTIESVLNKEDGAEISADTFFQKSEKELFNYRRKLQEAIKGIRPPLFVCYYCGQLVKLNGGGDLKKVLHFAHQKDSDFCDIKTNTKYSVSEINRIKYNGAKESRLHLETKKIISELLEENKGFSNIRVEKTLKSKNNLEWKKPDISTDYKDIKLVFEIQLSTTFLSVIVDREYFYQENQTYILWVFRHFEIEEFKQRFTEKDVFYSNNRNVFVLNDEAINLSQKNNNLYFLCYYQKPTIQELKLIYSWESEYVCFNQLSFDKHNYKVFFFDVDTVETEIKEKQNAIAEEQKRIESENRKKQIEKEQSQIRKVTETKLKDLKFQEINYDFNWRLKTGYNNLSEFQKVFLLPITELPDSLYSLFAKGYEMTAKDKIFLNKEFDIERLKDTYERDFEIIEYLTIATFYIKLKDQKSLMFKLPKIQYVLFAILSFKLKRVIRYNFQNLKQVFNYILNRKEHAWIFLNAVQEHYGLKKFLSEDEKGTFTEQLIRFRNEKPIQNNEHDEIVTLVFPKIMEHENYIIELLKSL